MGIGDLLTIYWAYQARSSEYAINGHTYRAAYCSAESPFLLTSILHVLKNPHQVVWRAIGVTVEMMLFYGTVHPVSAGLQQQDCRGLVELPG